MRFAKKKKTNYSCRVAPAAKFGLWCGIKQPVSQSWTAKAGCYTNGIPIIFKYSRILCGWPDKVQFLVLEQFISMHSFS